MAKNSKALKRQLRLEWLKFRVPFDLLAFFAERLKVYLRDKGARHDLIDAIFSLPGQDDLALIVKRVEALTDFLKTDYGANLLAGVKRAQNILTIEEKKDKVSHAGDVDASLLQADGGEALAAAIDKVKADTVAALNVENFAGSMRALAELRAPVDAFFDKVTGQRRRRGAAREPSASPVADPRRHPQRRRLHQDLRLTPQCHPGARPRVHHSAYSGVRGATWHPPATSAGMTGIPTRMWLG